MTLRTVTIAHIAAMLVVTAIAILLLACQVKAEYAPTYRSEFRWPWEPTACEECRRIREYRRRQREREWHARQHYERRHAKVWRDERAYTIYSRDDDHDDGRRRHCQDRVSVVGDQYASEAGAQEEANKAWMQTARWQYGERYMARDNAADANYECGRSSVGSVAGQVFYRCRLSARPCSAPKTRAN